MTKNRNCVDEPFPNYSGTIRCYEAIGGIPASFIERHPMRYMDESK